MGADFDPDRFSVVRSWNGEESRLETSVRSIGAKVVPMPGGGLTLELADGETMRTQLSTKFTRSLLEAELAEAGLSLAGWWGEAEGYAMCLASTV